MVCEWQGEHDLWPAAGGVSVCAGACTRIYAALHRASAPSREWSNKTPFANRNPTRFDGRDTRFVWLLPCPCAMVSMALGVFMEADSPLRSLGPLVRRGELFAALGRATIGSPRDDARGRAIVFIACSNLSLFGSLFSLCTHRPIAN